MATAGTIEDALHNYLDSLEDTRLDAVVRLVNRLSGISAEAWVGLSRPEMMQALSQRLGAALASNLLPGIDRLALDATRDISGLSASRIDSAVRQLESAQTGRSMFLPPTSQARTAQRMQDALNTTLTGSLASIRNLIAEVPPNTPERARVLLDRVRAEVISPLIADQTMANAIRGPMGEIANEAMLFADLRLRQPRLTPEQATQAIADQQQVWICALRKTCKDCLPRHGQTDSFQQWRLRGLPRTGWSVCTKNCMCMLIPAADSPGYAKLVEPLRREAMRIVREDVPRDMSVRVPRDLLEQEARGLRSKASRAERLKEMYTESPRVREAMRKLGEINSRRSL
jgi:hypothetical protein